MILATQNILYSNQVERTGEVTWSETYILFSLNKITVLPLIATLRILI